MTRAKRKSPSAPAPGPVAAPAAVAPGLLQLAFHNSPAMQSVVRVADGVLVEVNDTFLQKFGKTRAQVIGKTPFELNFWVEPEKLLEYRRQMEAHGHVLGYETRLRTGDGKILTILLSSHRVESDGATYYLTAGVDITARKEAEAKLLESERQLRESQARFGAAFNTSPVLMTIARLADAKFVEVNDAFVEVTGWTRKELIGHDSKELKLWVDLDERQRFFNLLRRNLVVRNFECQTIDRHGKIYTMHLSGQVIEINHKPHLITFGLDVTEQKRAEAELQNALAKERELSQLKSDFVSLVSHEFRTPLEIIMSSTDNLQRYHDRLAAAKREQLLNTINKSVRRMSGMMEEVLVLGRVESDKTEFKPVKFDLESCCRRVGDEIQTATGKRCPVELELKGALRNAFGDENLLRHILSNLLSNAVKYSPEGSAVTLAAARKGSKAILRIIDRGYGIPVADQKRLFQAFHRGSNVRQVSGTGLGLVIVRRCVELHGGEILCESAEGKGTTFTVTLPLFGKLAIRASGDSAELNRIL